MCPRCSNKKPFFNPQWPKQNTALHMVESKLKYNVFAFSLFCISLLYYVRCRFCCYVFSTNFVSWLTKQISNDKPAKLNMRCSNSRLQSTTLEWQLVKDHIAMVWLTPVTASTLPSRLHLLHLQSLLLHLHLPPTALQIPIKGMVTKFFLLIYCCAFCGIELNKKGVCVFANHPDTSCFFWISFEEQYLNRLWNFCKHVWPGSQE